MPRFPSWLALLAVMAGCNQRSCDRFPNPWRASGARPVASGDGLGEKHNAPLRLSFNPMMGPIRNHRWSEDDRLLVVWSDHTFIVFDVASERKLLTHEIESPEFVDNVEFSPDGRWIAVVSQRRGQVVPVTLRIFTAAGKAVRTVSTVPFESWKIARNGRALAWLEEGKNHEKGMRLHVDSLEGSEASRQFELPDTNSRQLWKLEWSASGRVLVVSTSGQTWIVDGNTARVEHYDSWTEPVLASQGDLVAWAEKDGFRLWSPEGERPLTLIDKRCMSHSWPHFSTSKFLFSSDELTLASSGSTGACLWETRTGRLKTVLRQFLPPDAGGPVIPVVWFNADRGLQVDSALWDVEHRRPIGRGFAEVMVEGSDVFALQELSQPNASVRLQTLDSQFALHEVATVSLNDCDLDLMCGHSLLAAGDGVFIKCYKKPLFVDLKAHDTYRRSIPPGVDLTASPLRRLLTLESREQIAIAQPSKEAPAHVLVQHEPVVVNGFDDDRMWMSNSPEWQIFNWVSLEFGKQGEPQLARGTATQPCGKGDQYLVGSHFLAAQGTEGGHGLVLCDLRSGRELGALNLKGRDVVAAVNVDGSLAVVHSEETGASFFWFVGEHRTTKIQGALRDVRFAGPHTIVALTDSLMVTLDALSGARSEKRNVDAKGRLLAADVDSQRALLADNGATLYNLASGDVIAQWPELQLVSAAFGPSGLLAASDESRIRVWQLPSTEPVGELLVDSTGYLFMHANGKFETTLPVASLSAMLSCNSGEQKLALERCLAALREPGLLDRVFALVAK
jgi:WD40 repeat protein